MWSLSLVMSECSLSGRDQAHVSNFYIVDLENFAAASRRYTGDIHNLVRGRFVYDTYKTMEATGSRHGWVHMFITHRPTVTLQLHNFDLFRTCRTSSFCIVAWQLAEVIFPPLLQPKLVLDLATREGYKAELTGRVVCGWHRMIFECLSVVISISACRSIYSSTCASAVMTPRRRFQSSIQCSFSSRTTAAFSGSSCTKYTLLIPPSPSNICCLFCSYNRASIYRKGQKPGPMHFSQSVKTDLCSALCRKRNKVSLLCVQ